MRYTATIASTFKVLSVSGDEHQVICPWHDDRTGKLYVNAHSGLYYCMRCGAKGSLEKMQVRPTVLGSDDVRETIRRMKRNQTPTQFYPETWLDKFDFPHDYWTVERGLPEQIVKDFRLGYDPFTNRMTIPLRDVRGRILGVTYRRLDGGKPKYLHPKGFPIGKHLFGAWMVRDERKVALVEGQVDAIRCWSERVPALGLMGARLTRDQLTVLKRLAVKTVVLLLDNDAAGVKGAVSVSEALEGSGLRVLIGHYRSYWLDSEGPIKDPDGLSGVRLRKMFHSAESPQQWAQRVL